LPWIILGVVVVAGIIAYIIISNRQSASSSDQHYTYIPDSSNKPTTSQWVTDLQGFANVLDDLTEHHVIVWR